MTEAALALQWVGVALLYAATVLSNISLAQVQSPEPEPGPVPSPEPQPSP